MALISLRLLRDYAAEHFFAFSSLNPKHLKQVEIIPVYINPANESYSHIPIVMHQEHGKSAAICDRAIQSGFSSVMMDGHCFNINKYTKGDYA